MDTEEGKKHDDGKNSVSGLTNYERWYRPFASPLQGINYALTISYSPWLRWRVLVFDGIGNASSNGP